MDSVRQACCIKTFGCQMNVHDSLKLRRLLEDEYAFVDHAEGADLILINTCSVRAKPEQKVYSLLGELRELKRRRPGLLVGVGGCVAQQHGVNLLRDYAVIDFVFGTANLARVPELIAARKHFGRRGLAVERSADWEDLPLGFGAGAFPVSVYISISRGCNQACSFCIVPQTRGAEVSRPAAAILAEVRQAAASGAREIMLLGQTVNSYGADLRPPLTFADLLDLVCAEPGVRRVRFASPYPRAVSPAFYEALRRHPQICRHMHLPLQSGSSRILKRMNRGYTREEYLQTAADLRNVFPDISITTDLIVGFPGETDQDFLETLDLIKQVEFDSSFSFMFSPRPGTSAAEMSDQIPDAVKAERLQRLHECQAAVTARRLQSWLGAEAVVLIDDRSRSDPACWRGRLSQNILVNLSAPADDVLIGMLVEVRVTSAARNTLIGDFLRPAE